MSEQTPTLTNGIPTKAYSWYDLFDDEGFVSRQWSVYKRNPHRVKAVDSHFFNKRALIVNQSWHEGGIFGLAMGDVTENTITDTSKLTFKSTCPKTGTLPPPEEVTAVVSSHAVISYLTTQKSIQDAKRVWFDAVPETSEIREAIFEVEDGIYRVQDLGYGTEFNEEFATEEAKKMMGSDAMGLYWTTAGRVTFHKRKENGCEDERSEEQYVPYVAEEHGKLRKAMEEL